MKENKDNKNKGTQSRREFFKEAAKKALPILGLPFISSTVLFTSCGKESEPSGCGHSCSISCYLDCEGTCSGNCNDSNASSGCTSCGDSCSSGCGSSCAEVCSRSCGEACTNSANNSSNETISEASGSIDGYDYVDLGLSVKWARHNVGATQPQISGRSDINPVNYLCPNEMELTNYLVSNGYWSGSGMKVEMAGNSALDYATKYWGNSWRSPSETELEELNENCDRELLELNSVLGVKLTSKINGNSIFIPLHKTEHEIKLLSSTFYSYQLTFTPIIGHLRKYNGNPPISFTTYTTLNSVQYEYKIGYVRAVTTGSGGSPTNCNGNCTNTATNNCSSCQIGCSTGCTQQCSSNCSTGCRTDCTGSCVNGCNTLCGGSCHYSCGGTCSYVSSGSSCTSGTCATTCRNYCYRTCTLACSESCMSCCITSSK